LSKSVTVSHTSSVSIKKILSLISTLNPTLTEFGIRDIHSNLLSCWEFCKNRRKESRSLHKSITEKFYKFYTLILHVGWNLEYLHKIVASIYNWLKIGIRKGRNFLTGVKQNYFRAFNVNVHCNLKHNQTDHAKSKFLGLLKWDR
jgi:hypothetical protein